MSNQNRVLRNSSRQPIRFEVEEPLNFVSQSESSIPSPKYTKELSARAEISSRLSVPFGSLQPTLRHRDLHPHLVCSLFDYFWQWDPQYGRQQVKFEPQWARTHWQEANQTNQHHQERSSHCCSVTAIKLVTKTKLVVRLEFAQKYYFKKKQFWFWNLQCEQK